MKKMLSLIFGIAVFVFFLAISGALYTVDETQQVVITQFGQRYKTMEEIESDAKDVFSNTICAYDFMKIKI